MAEEVFKILSMDKDFLTNIESGINKITNDGKIDSSDIPELIHIITMTCNNIKTCKLTENEYPALLKLLCKHIIDKYKIIDSSKAEEIDKLIDSTIKLVMLKPAVSIEEVTGILQKLVTCSCCK